MAFEGNNDISINELKRYIKIFWSYVIKKVHFLLILCICGISAGYLYAKFQKTRYIGTLSFVLSVESKGGGLSGLASQFGLDLSNSSSNDVFTGDNIITLFKSNKLIRKTLFKKIPANNNLLINLIIKDQQLDKQWNKKTYLQGKYFFSKDSLLSPVQDSLINEICLLVSDKLLSITRPDKKLSVYFVNTTSSNELFSCFFTQFLMDESARFYIDTKTSIAKSNLKMLYREADSLKNLLSGSIISTASETDKTFNLNPALQVKRSAIQKGQINISVIGAAYTEVIKNLELAKINLQKEMPLYQIIDVPQLPLKAIRKNFLICMLIGFSVSFLIGISVLIITFFFRK